MSSLISNMSDDKSSSFDIDIVSKPLPEKSKSNSLPSEMSDNSVSLKLENTKSGEGSKKFKRAITVGSEDFNSNNVMN